MIKKEKINTMKQKYNPMSKEFQDECKRLGLTGVQLIQKYKGEGKIVSNSKANDMQQKVIIAGCKTYKEYRDKNAQKLGYDNNSERVKVTRWEQGIYEPMEFNQDCSSYFGIYIAEKYIIQTFEDPIKMPPNNPGFDWLCKNGLKIQCKARCIGYRSCCDSSIFEFLINRNKIADWFILSCWDNRDSLIPLLVLTFHKNDIVRGRKFCEFVSLTITNKPENLKEFEKFEASSRLKKLKEICKYKNQ